MISMIAAMDHNRNIGFNDDMPWGKGMKSDLKRFKDSTMNKTVVMGRKTFESLPGSLPGRQMVVLTKDQNFSPPGVWVYHDFWSLQRDLFSQDLFVIGGAQIYELFMPYADKIYLTKVHAYLEGDTKFPEIRGKWKITQGESHHLDGDQYGSQYVIYERERE